MDKKEQEAIKFDESEYEAVAARLRVLVQDRDKFRTFPEEFEKVRVPQHYIL